MARRTLIVGDVHGCIEELKEVLEKAEYNKSRDRLISVGDVINKGPESKACLEYLESQSAEMIQGNHEYFFLKSFEESAPEAQWFAKLKQELGPDLEYWKNSIRSWPYFIREQSFDVVHAGKVPGEDLPDSDPYLLCSIRTWDGKGIEIADEGNPAWFEFYNEPKPIIFGHWARRGLVWRKNAVGLDTGCVYGRKLSLLELESRNLIQIGAKRIYKKVPAQG